MAAKQNSNDMQEMFAAFVAFMQDAQDHGDTGKDEESRGKRTTAATTKRATRSTPRGRKASEINAETASKRKSATVARKTPAGVITCGQAWELLGADPTYAPSNPSAPARNAQLWALNAKGLLRLA